MKVLLAIFLIVLMISFTGCMWFEAANSSLTKQELAIQNKDWRECKKASMPDVCILGYAKALQDKSVCHIIRDNDYRDMCDEILCGGHKQACCYAAENDGCDYPAACYKGTCYACGLIGMSSCLIDGGELCYEGSLTDDYKCK